MKEKKLYTCEICHTDYANPKDAEACEGSHKPTWGKGFKVEGVYRPIEMCPDGIPGMLWVTFSDGNRILYRNTHEDGIPGMLWVTFSDGNRILYRNTHE